MSYNIEIINQIKQKRINGLSLSQLKTEYPLIPQGTIYGWIEDIPVSESFKKLKRKETRQLKTAAKRQNYIENGKLLARKYHNNKLFIAGCSLYWGEGHKNNQYFGLTNCDPSIHLIIIDFVKQFFPNQFKIARFNIQKYDTANLIDIENYWSNCLKFPIKISYVTTKKSPESIDNNNGILTIIISSTELIHNIKGAIDELFNTDLKLKDYRNS